MSPMPPYLLRLGSIALISTLTLGCAKYPTTGGPNTGARLIFRMTTDGPLRTGQGAGEGGLPYVYIIAFNLSEDISPMTNGPIPVVVPSGNGMMAGNATHFVLWDPLASPQYQLYKFRDNTLNEWTLVGTPVNSLPVNQGDTSLNFELDMSQLVPTVDLTRYKTLQTNFFTMNNRNTSGGGRLWDALGNSSNIGQINSFINARLDINRAYNNTSEGDIEPRNDVADPALDISDWSIEVRANF